MRVYLPATMARLVEVLEAGEVDAPVAFAVTPTLLEWYVEGDEEELEYAATTAAARASLRLIASDRATSARRVVLAADVPDASARPAPDVDRAAVRLVDPVPLARVVSVHVDDAAAEADVRAAVGALAGAHAGDEDAQFVVDGVEDHELAWYAAQEIGPLVELET
ncbi:MAG: DUF6912 family protein [Nocardioidaceae bacterium]